MSGPYELFEQKKREVKKVEIKKKKKKLSNLWDNIKMPKTHLAGILEERDLIYEKSGPKMSQI